MNSVSALRELASAAGMAEKRTDSRTSEQTIMKSFPDGKLLKTINFIVNSKRGLDGLTVSAGNSYFGSMGVAQSNGGDLALTPLLSHYVGGSGSNYVMNESSFNGVVALVATTNGINFKVGTAVPNVKGLYKVDVSTYGTKYANAAGYATLYYNNTGVVGYSDWWNFESHGNGDRDWWLERKTEIGAAIPGNPFWVLYGITPPTNEIPKH